jgi:hypothetical protein
VSEKLSALAWLVRSGSRLLLGARQRRIAPCPKRERYTSRRRQREHGLACVLLRASQNPQSREPLDINMTLIIMLLKE